MSKHLSEKKTVTNALRITVINLIRLSFLIGMFLIILGVDNIKNYKDPILFGTICGLIGIGITFIISQKTPLLKIIFPKQKSDAFHEILMIACFFIGMVLLPVSILNEKLSRLDSTNYGLVADKYISGARIERRILTVKIGEEIYKLNSSDKFWNETVIGDDIKVRIYKSQLGFDFLKISEE